MMKTSDLRLNTRTGKLALAALSCFVLMSANPAASQTTEAVAPLSKEQMVEQLSTHFSSVPTMSGEFVQFGPNGEQTGGKFFLERPGKIRFNYEKPASVEVISNGKTVAVHNSKLKTWDFYPLDKTPLKMLLSDKVSAKDKSIRDVISEADLTTIVMGDNKVFGDAVITLMFDPASFDLRQWTIKDSQGKETSVMVFNVQKNVEIPAKMFSFDEREIQRRLQESKQRG